MDRMTSDIASGKYAVEHNEGTLRQAIELFLTRPVRPGRTDALLMGQLDDWLGHKMLRDVTGVELAAWVQGRSRKPGTQARRLASVKAMLSHAKSLGLRVPEFHMKRPSYDDARNRWLTPDERDRLVDAIDPASRALLTFLFHTGARVGEALQLVWYDVRLEVADMDAVLGAGSLPKGSVPAGVFVPHVILRSKKGKGSRMKWRIVPLNETARNVLWGLRTGAAKRNDWKEKGLDWPVFPGVLGKAMVYGTFLNHVRAACEVCGIEDMRIHDARHTFASQLIQEGVREKLIADMLGHSNLAMMQRYSHVGVDHLADAVKVLERG
jgi:integrase